MKDFSEIVRMIFQLILVHTIKTSTAILLSLLPPNILALEVLYCRQPDLTIC